MHAALMAAVLVATVCPRDARAQTSTTETLTFASVADTYVDAGAPTSNFNSSKVLLAGGTPARITYLRFTVTGVSGRTIRSARLRLGIAQASLETSGVAHLISDHAWVESKATWNARPVVDGLALATVGAAAVGTVVEFNLDGAIRTDGTYDVAIDGVSTQAVGFAASGASSGQKPALVLGVAAGPNPTVTIVQPPDASVFFEGDRVTFQGTAHDAADGDLSDAIVWRSSLQGALGTGASVATVLNRGSHTITASVTDADGLRGSATSHLTVTPAPPANTAPLVAITAPIDGATFVVGQPVTFVGSANDIEEGVLSPALQWTSDRDGTLGTGATFTKTLSEGTHKITARATDHGGLQGKTSATVTIVAPNALAFLPTADAYVDAGAPKANYGSSSVLRVYGGATRTAYLRFVVAGVGGQQISRAVLRLRTDSASAAASDSGGTASLLTPSAWQESKIAFETAPPATGAGIATAGPVAADTLVDFDVTGAVTGDGTWELALTTASLDEVAYRSKESKTPPQLLLTVTGNPPLVTITAPPTGSVFLNSAPIPLAATATDVEDGNLANALKWTSNLDGALGTGAQIAPKLKVGTHTITAAVVDHDGRPGEARILMRVRAPNVAPKVTITAPKTGLSAPAGELVTLTATALDDFDGDLTTRISWSSSRDGLIGVGGARTVLLSEGTHVLTATVTDSDGAVGMAQLTRIIVPSAPTVTIVSPRAGAPFFTDVPAVLTGTALDATDGDVSSRLVWTSSLDGPLGTGATVTTSALRLGTHTITAAVRDSGGLLGQATRTVLMRPPNMKPVLTLLSPLDGSGTLGGKPILLAADAIDAEDGDLSSIVRWTSSRDGNIGTGALITRSTLSLGTHVITATVNDRDGATATATATVTVTAATLTFPAVADTYVDAGTPTKTYGTASGLMVSGSPVRQALFRFAVQGLGAVAVDKAVVRLTVGTSSSDGSPAGGTLQAITNDTWPEKTTSWANHPTLDGLPLATAPKVVAKQVVDFDVTPALHGNGSYDFALTSPSSDPVKYQSREASARPVLVVSLKQSTAPVVRITTPTSGTKVGANTPLVLAGQAVDAERGNVSAEIVWRSDVDGPLGKGATLTVPALSAGTHVITAVVSDPDGTTGRAQVTVRVRGPNLPPTLKITSPFDGASFPAGTAVTLAGAVTDEWDEDLAGRVTWTSSRDGALGLGASRTAVLSEGIHTVTATVTDHDGATTTARITVTITPTPPVVTIVTPALDGQVIVAGTALTLLGTAIDATDGNLSAGLVWSSDRDGYLGTGASVTTSTLTAGTHMVTASATDAGGLVAKARRTVIVDAVPTIAIVSPPDGTVLLAAKPVVLAAQATDAEDGDVGAAVRWSSDRDGALGAGPVLTVPGLSAGLHLVTATVTDRGGATASASIHLDIRPAGFTFTPIADTYVDSSKATTSFGTAAELFAGASPDRQTLLRFQVTGVAPFVVDRALLHLKAGSSSADATKVGPSVYALPGGSAWSETTTWSTRPALPPNALAVAAAVTVGQVLEVDVTPAVRGDGTIDLALASTSSDWARFLSREASSGRPELVVTLKQRAPDVVIYQPAPVDYLLTGAPIRFAATAVDPDDGDVGASLTWTSDLDGVIGRGPVFATSTLSVGTHTITAAAVNHTGVAGTAKVTIVLKVADLTFPAIADTYVDELQPTIPLGIDPALIAGAPPGQMIVYMRFAVAGIGTLPVSDARIRLLVRSTKNASGGVGGAIRKITDNTWSEATTTWAKHPSISGTILDTVTLPVVQGQVVDFRLGTTVVKDGTYNFAVTSDSPDAVKYNSREGAQAPRLVVAFRQPAPLGPDVAITTPAAPSLTMFDDESLVLAGTATDARDGMLTKSLAWRSSLDGALGTGGSVTVKRLSLGTHVVTASVKNKAGAAGAAAVTVTVVDRPPALAITAPANDRVFNVGAPITFTATAIDDGDVDLRGNVVWTSDRDGQFGVGGSVTTTLLSYGDHVITATVANSLGTTATATIRMAVGNASPRLTLVAPADGTSLAEGTSLALVASAVDLEDGDLGDAIVWTSSLQGPLGLGRSVPAVLTVVGTQRITASVTDSGGVTRTAEANVQVTLAPPMLQILTPADNSSSSGPVRFAGRALDFRDGDRSGQIRWRSSLDGILGRGSSIGPRALSLGRHVITAEVTDSDGLTASRSIAVVIGNTAPTVRIVGPPDGTTVRAWSPVTLEATASDVTDGSLDAAIRWSSNLSGPLGTGAAITTSALARGTHVITAQAVNAHGLTGSDQTIVLVGTGPVSRPPFVAITAPAQGADVPAETPLTFSGTALVPGGDLSANLVWVSDVDGVIGTGASFTTDTLSLGTHHVTASLTDAAGTIGSASVDVTVSVPTLTFRAVADANTDSLQPGVNFGGEPVLDLDNQPVRRIYLRFVASGIPADRIDHAFVRLTVNDVAGGGSDFGGEMHVVDGPWDESALTHLNKPPLAAPILDTAGVVDRGQTVSFDVTSAVSGDGMYTFGMRTASNNGVEYLSREARSGGPRLVVVLTAPSRSRPALRITAPADGASTPGGPIGFAATATDASGADIGTITWRSDRDGNLGSGRAITKALSRGVHVVTATATDAAGHATTAVVRVTTTGPTAGSGAPSVTILAPASGAALPFGTPVALLASAYDAQDGDLSFSLHWTSSLDGPLGTGPALVRNLSPGTHTLTATVADSSKKTGTATLRVQITATRVGYEDFTFGPSIEVSLDKATATKPQSRLWYHDGIWWGSLFVVSRSEYHIHRLDLATQTWVDTGVLVDDRGKSRQDALVDGDKLYVASRFGFTGTPPQNRVLRFTYHHDAQTYALDPGFPVDVPGGGAEALTIAKDSLDRLWIAYALNGQVFVLHTLTTQTEWTAPFQPAVVDGTLGTPDDDAAVIALPNGRIGVFWGNQAKQRFYFAVHTDTGGDTDKAAWKLEIPSTLPMVADDHFNLKLASDGRLFVAVKTSSVTPGQVQVGLFVRSTSGTWSPLYPVTTYTNSPVGATRPTCVLDDANRRVYVAYSTSMSDIYYESSSMDAISFGPETPLMVSGTNPVGAGLNDPIGTKQNVDPGAGLLLIASTSETDRYWHGWLVPPAPRPTVTITAPGDGTHVALGTPVTLTASAFSPTDGRIDAQLRWTSDMDGPLGSGASLSATLSRGAHAVTATATDSALVPGSATVTVVVE